MPESSKYDPRHKFAANRKQAHGLKCQLTALHEKETQPMSKNISSIQGNTLSTNQARARGFMGPHGSLNARRRGMHACIDLGTHQAASRPKGGRLATKVGRPTTQVARPKVGTTNPHVAHGSSSLAPNGSSRCKRLQLLAEHPCTPPINCLGISYYPYYWSSLVLSRGS